MFKNISQRGAGAALGDGVSDLSSAWIIFYMSLANMALVLFPTLPPSTPPDHNHSVFTQTYDPDLSSISNGKITEIQDKACFPLEKTRVRCLRSSSSRTVTSPELKNCSDHTEGFRRRRPIRGRRQHSRLVLVRDVRSVGPERHHSGRIGQPYDRLP